jgi:hypothetical protein
MRSRGRGGGFTVRLDTTCTGGGDSIVDLGGTLIASGGLFFGDGTDNILGVVYILEDAGSCLHRRGGGFAKFLL